MNLDRVSRSVFAILSLVWIATPFITSTAIAQSADPAFPVTNGTVWALAVSGNTLYLGGDFSRVGPQSGCGVPVDPASGAPLAGFPKVAGIVRAVASDGAGGWYIGGTFNAVGGLARTNLAHVRSDFSVGPLDGNVNGDVLALALGGNTLYVGGTFNQIAGVPRTGTAGIDVTTGAATAFFSNNSGTARAIAVYGSTIILGGASFWETITTERHGLVAVDAASGDFLPWPDPPPGTLVQALVLDGSVLYVGGQFSVIGSMARSHVAALDLFTGTANSWNPSPNGAVTALAVGAGKVFVAGSFNTIGGQSRAGLAAIDAAGLATSWNPSPNAAVSALATSPTTVYVGGAFSTIGAQSRNYAAGFDAGTGAITAWNPNPGGPVLALGSAGPSVYLGGDFSMLGAWQARNRVAAIDLGLKTVTSWNPNADNTVRALAVSGSIVYVGGGFGVIGGGNHSTLAAIDATTGVATSWNPQAGFQLVSAIAVSGSTIYVGGNFLSMGGQPRRYAAAVDATTGLATAWDPDPNLPVWALAVSGSTVYLGGQFTLVKSTTRNDIAAVDATLGNLASWNPNSGNQVFSLLVNGATVIAGGQFFTIGGKSRAGVAVLDMGTGAAIDPWSGATAIIPVNAVALAGSTLYAGGSDNCRGIDLSTGAFTSWNVRQPAPMGQTMFSRINALVASGSNVYAGGSFQALQRMPTYGAASLSQTVVGVPSPPAPPAFAELRAAAPNPARGSCTIGFSLAKRGSVTLRLFDLAGREVRTLLRQQEMSAGPHEARWDARRLKSGVYFYRLETEGLAATRKVVVLDS